MVTAEHRDPECDETDPDRDRRPLDVVDERLHAGVDQRADDAEDHEKAERHSRADDQCRADAGPRVFVGSLRRLDAEEVGEVGGQHREAAGVDRRDEAGCEGQRQRCVDHVPNRSLTRSSSADCERAPLWTSTTVPSASMKTVVGITMPPNALEEVALGVTGQVVGDAGLLGDRLSVGGAVLVVHAEEGDLVAHLLVGGLEGGHLADARGAPGGEEVHYEGGASIVGERRLGAVEALEGFRGRRIAGLARCSGDGAERGGLLVVPAEHHQRGDDTRAEHRTDGQAAPDGSAAHGGFHG